MKFRYIRLRDDQCPHTGRDGVINLAVTPIPDNPTSDETAEGARKSLAPPRGSQGCRDTTNPGKKF